MKNNQNRSTTYGLEHEGEEDRVEAKNEEEAESGIADMEDVESGAETEELEADCEEEGEDEEQGTELADSFVDVDPSRGLVRS